eukprot:tig00000459_g1116.t1
MRSSHHIDRGPIRIRQVVGMLCPILGCVQAGSKTHADLVAALTAGRCEELEFGARRRDGTPWVANVHLQPVRCPSSGKITNWLGLVRDVTAPRVAEAAQAAARAALIDAHEKAGRAEAASQAKSSWLLLESRPLTEDQRELANGICASGQSMLDFIDDALDFAKIEAGKLQLGSAPFGLRACLDAALSASSARAHVGVHLACSVTVDEALGSGRPVGDEVKLRQVLNNFTSNALLGVGTTVKFSVRLGWMADQTLPSNRSATASPVGVDSDANQRRAALYPGLPATVVPALRNILDHLSVDLVALPDSEEAEVFAKNSNAAPCDYLIVPLPACCSLQEAEEKEEKGLALLNKYFSATSDVGGASYSGPRPSTAPAVVFVCPHEREGIRRDAGAGGRSASEHEFILDGDVGAAEEPHEDGRLELELATGSGSSVEVASGGDYVVEFGSRRSSVSSVYRSNSVSGSVVDSASCSGFTVGSLRASTCLTNAGRPILSTPLTFSRVERAILKASRAAATARAGAVPGATHGHLKLQLQRAISCSPITAAAPAAASPAPMKRRVSWYGQDLQLPEQQQPACEPQSQSQPCKRNPVLVADDHPMNRLVIERLLGGMGVAVDFVSDGDEALAKWEAGRHSVVLLDLNMPRMRGIEACERILQLSDRDACGGSLNGRRPFVVAITADADEATRERCSRAGMAGFLLKPFRVEEFRNMVSSALLR